KLQVPLPGRGYWARKAVRNAPARPSLPALKKGEATTIPSDASRAPPRAEPTPANGEAATVAHGRQARHAEQGRWQQGMQQRAEAEPRAHQAERANQLEADVARWRLAREIREYVEASAQAVMEGGCRVEGGPFGEWSEWALGHADAIDPVEEMFARAVQTVRERDTRIARLAAAAGVTLLPQMSEPGEP
ncbi:MAG: hypothetical protein WCJ30_20515, partial [Deltaproteobacteria bacterium]